MNIAIALFTRMFFACFIAAAQFTSLLFQPVESLLFVNNPVPVINSLSPDWTRAGSSSVQVTITGSNFVMGAVVRWNGENRVTTYASGEVLRVLLSASDVAAPGVGEITVFNPGPGGGTSNSKTFTVYARPVNDDFSGATLIAALPYTTTQNVLYATTVADDPILPCTSYSTGGTTVWYAYTAAAGGSLTIDTTNTNYTDVVAVWTGAAGNLMNHVCKYGSATLNVQAGVTYYIEVASQYLQESYSTLKLNLTFSPNYISPTITKIDPNLKISSTEGFLLTVEGSGFRDGAVLRWNGTDKATTFVSGTKLTAQINAADVATAQTYSVTVFNPGPGGGTSTAVDFVVVPAVPNDDFGAAILLTTFPYQHTLTNIRYATNASDDPILSCSYSGKGNYSVWYQYTPSETGWLTVDTTGSTFSFLLNSWTGTRGTLVNVGCYSGSGNQQFQMPMTAGKTYYLEAASQWNTPYDSTLSLKFTFSRQSPVPTIYYLDPSSAQMGKAGGTINVFGSNFMESSVVRWDGENRATTFINASKISFQLTTQELASPSSHQVTVFNPAPGGGVSDPKEFLIRNPYPSISAINPDKATAGAAGFILQVRGYDHNFNQYSVVRVNGSNRTTTFINDNELAAEITAGDIATAGVLLIDVLNPAPGGGAASQWKLKVGQPILNDDFNNATILPDFPYQQDIFILNATSATDDPGLPCFSSQTGFYSIWYQYTPAQDVWLRVDTTGSAYSTALAVWTGSRGSLSNEACHYSNGSGGSKVLLPLAAGSTYYIEVVSTSSYLYDYALKLAVNFSSDAPEPSITSLSPGWAATSSAAQVLLVNGSGFSGNAVIRWNGSDRATEYVSSTQLRTTLSAADLAAAGNYPINVFNPAPGGGSSNSVDFQVVTPPDFDEIDHAVEINSIVFSHSATIRYATTASDDPLLNFYQSGTQQGYHSVWYRYTAPESGWLTVDTNSTNYSHLLVLWSGMRGSLVRQQYTAGSGWGTQIKAQVSAGEGYSIEVISLSDLSGQTYAGNLTFNARFENTNPSPFLYTISPDWKPAGNSEFTLSVSGSNFINSSVVRWNGTDLATTMVNNNNLTAVVPASLLSAADRYPITVFTPGPGGGTTNSLYFTVAEHVPNDDFDAATVIDSLPYNGYEMVQYASTAADDPYVRCPGENGGNQGSRSVWYKYTPVADGTLTVKTTGSNYAHTIAVWSGVRVGLIQHACMHNTADYSYPSNRSVDMMVTAGKTYFIEVAGPPETTYNAYLYISFSFTNGNPKPEVYGTSPGQVYTTDGPFTLMVIGNGFFNGSVIRWNGVERETRFYTPQQLLVKVSAVDIATAGTYPITVFNPGPGGGTSNSVDFRVNNPYPSIQSLEPANVPAGGAGFTLAVRGKNFVPGAVVKWDQINRPTTYVSPYLLTIAVNVVDVASAGNHWITVENPAPGGGSVSGNYVTVFNPAANDDFDNAVVVGAVPFNHSQNIGGATLAPDDPTDGCFSSASKTVWYRFTPTESGWLTVDTSGSSFTPGIGIWTGTRGALLNKACRYSYGASSPFKTAVNAGTIYFVGVDWASYSSSGTELKIAFDIVPPTTVPAPVISSLYPTSRLAGYGAFALEVSGTGFVPETVVRWNGEERPTRYISAQYLIASITAADVAVANEYPVTVFTPAPGGGESTARNFTVLERVANDDFNNATVIDTMPFIYKKSVKTATHASDDPYLPCSTGRSQPTVWLRYTPPEDGLLSFYTWSLDYEATLAVWIGSRGSLTNQACIPGRFVDGSYWNDTTMRVSGGTTYYFEVATGYFPSPSSDLILNIRFDFAPLNPAPIISWITPEWMPGGRPDFTLTVTGSKFMPDSVVLWNGEELPTTFVSYSKLQATVPASAISTTGTAEVRVFTPAPGGGASEANVFTIYEPVVNDDFDQAILIDTMPYQGSVDLSSATWASDDPASPCWSSANGAYKNVWFRYTPTQDGTLTGKLGYGTLGIWRGGTRGNLTSLNCRQFYGGSDGISTALKAGTTYSIEVSQPGYNIGSSTAIELSFVAKNPSPQISSHYPYTIVAGDTAFTLKLLGSGFTEGSVVRWDGVDRSTTFINSEQLSIDVTARDIAAVDRHDLTVFNPGPGGGTSDIYYLSVSAPASIGWNSSITSLEPGLAYSGSTGITLQVTGGGFSKNSVVLWNGIDRTTTYINPSILRVQLTNTDLAQPGSFRVAVFTPTDSIPLSSTKEFIVAQAVPNDEIGNAIEVGELPYNHSENILGATTAGSDPALPCASGGQGFKTVWYRYMATQNGWLTASTAGSNFDTLLTIWNGPEDGPTNLGCSDNAGYATTSTLGMEVTTGKLYYIQAAANTDLRRTANLNLDLSFSAENPQPIIEKINPSLTLAGGPSFLLHVAGSGFTSSSRVLWNGDERATSFMSSNLLTATIDAVDIASVGNVTIRVANPAPGGGTSNAAELSVVAPVINDQIENAIVIDPNATNFRYSENVFNATIDSSDPMICNESYQGYHSVWFRYTPEQDGVLSVSTEGSNYSAYLNIWAGQPGVHANNPCSDADTMTGAKVKAGTTYFIETVSPESVTSGGYLVFSMDFSTPDPSYPSYPSVYHISPTAAAAGGPEFTLTVSGDQFVDGAVVLWNDAARPTTYVSPTQLLATISAADIAAAGNFPVRVLNPGSVISEKMNFKVVAQVSHDDIQKAIMVDTVPYQHSVDFLQATAAVDDPALPCGPEGYDRHYNTVWYRYTPATDGTLSASLSRTDMYSRLAIWTGTPGALSLQGCSYATYNTNTPAQLDVFATAGTAYFVEAESWASDYSSTIITMNVAFATDNPLPKVTSLEPGFVLAGRDVFTMTVNGSSFVPGVILLWNGMERETTYVNANQLTATIPAGDVLSAGNASVTVSNPAPGGGNSAAVTFTVATPVQNDGFQQAVDSNTWLFSHHENVRYATEATDDPLVPCLVNSRGYKTGWYRYTPTSNGTLFLSTFGSDFNTFIAVWTGSQGALTSQGCGMGQGTSTNMAVSTGTTYFIETGSINPLTLGGNLQFSLGFSSDEVTLAINNLYPASALAGGPGFTLHIYGKGFNQTTKAQVNGLERETVFISATHLSISVSESDLAQAGTLEITVSGQEGTSNILHFMIDTPNPVPAISSISPVSILAGHGAFTLTVNGSDFVEGAKVRWNGISRATTFVSDTQLSAQIPMGDVVAAGTAHVTVYNPAPGGGTSTAIDLTIIQPNPVPVITSFSPSQVIAGGPAFTLTVVGTGFIAGSEIQWNGEIRTTTLVDATHLTIQVPAADIATAGVARISLYNPAPGGGTSEAVDLKLVQPNPVPAIRALQPEQIIGKGPAFTLTVTGSGFVPTSVIQWNGASRATLYVSDTELKGTISAVDIANAGTIRITVSNPAPGGGKSAAMDLVIIQPNPTPTISGMTPAQAVTGDAAFTLTIKGSGFVQGCVVRWNGENRLTTYVSSTEVTAAITADDIATNGVAQVTVFNPEPGGGISSAVQFTITAAIPTPTISGLSPAQVEAGGAGFTLTVSGTGFVNGAAIRWNGEIKDTTFVGETQLAVKVSADDIASAGEIFIEVINPGGTVSNSVRLRILSLSQIHLYLPAVMR